MLSSLKRFASCNYVLRHCYSRVCVCSVACGSVNLPISRGSHVDNAAILAFPAPAFAGRPAERNTGGCSGCMGRFLREPCSSPTSAAHQTQSPDATTAQLCLRSAGGGEAEFGCVCFTCCWYQSAHSHLHRGCFRVRLS